MDELVKKAMAKWPNVPDCYGWLGLDARGRWFMRDEATQCVGAFSSGRLGAKGSELQHEKLIEFIGRNYACDNRGQWFFQNGPQRVYVELEVTPWVWRIEPNGSIFSHTGLQVEAMQCIVDENGRLFISTNTGLGLVHSQDVQRAAEWIESNEWDVQKRQYDRLIQEYGFVTSPSDKQ